MPTEYSIQQNDQIMYNSSDLASANIYKVMIKLQTLQFIYFLQLKIKKNIKINIIEITMKQNLINQQKLMFILENELI
ncbi:hypothetical protein pb186bvf_019865 [Paramecium bursaria]